MRAEAEIKFECSQCGQRLCVEIAGAGTATTCPNCQGVVVIPHIEALTHTAALTDPVMSSREVSVRAARAPDPLEPEASVLRDKLHEMERNCRRLQKEVAASRAEKEFLETRLSQASEERDQFVSTFALLQAESRDLQTKLTDLQIEKEELRRHAASQGGELATYMERFEKLQQYVDECEEERDRFRRDVVSLRDEVGRLQTQLSAIGPVGEELERLKAEVAASKEASEFVRLCRKAEAGEDQQRIQERELVTCRSEINRLNELGEALRRELSNAREHYLAAEKRADALSEEKVQQDNSILRSVLARQKGELENCYRELRHFRRAQLGLRLVYALFALGLLGVLAFAWQMLPEIDLNQLFSDVSAG